MTTITIDEKWSMQIASNITLLEEVEPEGTLAKHSTRQIVRGYYAHVDEALKSYLRKSINPSKEVIEIVEKIDHALEKISKVKKERKK